MVVCEPRGSPRRDRGRRTRRGVTIESKVSRRREAGTRTSPRRGTGFKGLRRGCASESRAGAEGGKALVAEHHVIQERNAEQHSRLP